MTLSYCLHCGECGKYKCPTCRQPYCSLKCYQTHKATPCTRIVDENPEAKEQETSRMEYDFPTDDTVPLEKLKLLENSTALKTCLQNPHVRKILEQLDKSAYPDALMKEYMQEPIFTELVDECLKIVQPKEDLETL